MSTDRTDSSPASCEEFAPGVRYQAAKWQGRLLDRTILLFDEVG